MIATILFLFLKTNFLIIGGRQMQNEIEVVDWDARNSVDYMCVSMFREEE